MRKKEQTTVPVTARISTDLRDRVENIRAKASLRPGDPAGSAPLAVILRWALEDWAKYQEKKLGIRNDLQP